MFFSKQKKSWCGLTPDEHPGCYIHDEEIIYRREKIFVRYICTIANKYKEIEIKKVLKNK